MFSKAHDTWVILTSVAPLCVLVSSSSQALFIDTKLRMLIASLQIVFLRTLWDAPHKQNGPWRRPFAERHMFFFSFQAGLWTETGNDSNGSRVQLHLNTPCHCNHSTRPRHETAPRCHPGRRDTLVCPGRTLTVHPWSHEEEEEAVVVSTHESLHCAHHRHK